MDVKLTAAEVKAGAMDNYDPARYDAQFHSDGSVTLIPLLWWDDASYARYQSAE
jgi:hypothetical protein